MFVCVQSISLTYGSPIRIEKDKKEDPCSISAQRNENAQCVLYENLPCNEKDGQLELESGDFLSIYTGFRNTKSIGSIFVRSGCQLTVWKGDYYDGQQYSFRAENEDLRENLDDSSGLLKSFANNINSMTCQCGFHGLLFEI